MKERTFYGFDIEPNYVAIARQRLGQRKQQPHGQTQSAFLRNHPATAMAAAVSLITQKTVVTWHAEPSNNGVGGIHNADRQVGDLLSSHNNLLTPRNPSDFSNSVCTGTCNKGRTYARSHS